MRARLARHEGRRPFRQGSRSYDRSRPGHVEGPYEVLREQCGLGPGAKVLEMGPGAGQATASRSRS